MGSNVVSIATGAVTSDVGTVVLASGASGSSRTISCAGAGRVYFAVKCDVTDQLSAAGIVVTMTDGKEIALSSGGFSGGVGVDSALAELNVIGGVTLQDLSGTTHRGICVRSMRGQTLSGPSGLGPLTGVVSARLDMTKAATGGNSTYTIYATVYAT